MKYVLPFLIVALLSIALFSLMNGSVQKKTTHLKPPQEYFESRNFPFLGEGQKSYQQAVNRALLQSKKYRSNTTPWDVEGPHNIGGRITCIAIDKNNTQIMYIGTPAVGIFKTTNGGSNWTHLFKNEASLAIGALAIHPNNSNIIYAGTGDNALSSFTYLGRGIYKSSDGGNTWTNIGLSNTAVITEIVINPLNPLEIYAAAMGNIYAPDNNRGLYKSTDGGNSWSQVLFLSNQAGVMDVVMDYSSPDTLFATGMHRYRNNQGSYFSGTKTKIYRTFNGGQTWDTLTNGLPTGPDCKITLALSQNNPNLIYASYCDNTLNYAGLYKTTNSGNSWSFVSQDPNMSMGGFGWYFGGLRLDPNNDNIIYWMGIDLFKSTNGGNTWSLNAPAWYTYDVHADKHDLQFIGNNSYVLATDGGLYSTTVGGGTNASSWNYISEIPITQFYRVAYNPFDTASYYGGAQDNGTQMGSASNGLSNWFRYFGGDGFLPAFDTLDQNIFYAETQNGSIYVTADGGFNWDPLSNTLSSSDRCNWNMPYVLSKHFYQQMYTGTYRVYLNNYALYDNWTPISPDLTDGTNNVYHTITSVDESPITPNLLYAGTSDARIWVTQNGGTNWTPIYTGMPNRYVSCVKASPNVSNGVFLSYWGYRDNDTTAYIYYSSNYGNTWTSIASSSLPNFAINDIWVKPDGSDSSILVANDGGVYATRNRGITWNRVGSNMPIIPVYDLEYNKAKQKIFAGTFAMSMQSMDIDSAFKDNTISNPTATTLLPVKDEIKIYPNPTTREVQVTLPLDAHYQVDVFNSLGQPILHYQPNRIPFTIDLGPAAPGDYFIRCRSGEKSVVKKVVKLR
jgi:photosystem II stability/assembly factor-like uncharacterized protein